MNPEIMIGAALLLLGLLAAFFFACQSRPVAHINRFCPRCERCWGIDNRGRLAHKSATYDWLDYYPELCPECDRILRDEARLNRNIDPIHSGEQ